MDTYPPLKNHAFFKKVYPTYAPINDHSLIYDKQRWHVFHIWMSKDRDDVIGHAISSDLLHWKEQPDILPKGKNPSWETSRGGNAPFVFVWEDTYYLFYSRYGHNGNCCGSNIHEPPQHIGLATSQDLYHWEKYPNNPIFHPAPSWSPWGDYESDQYRPHCCRDPHVIRIGKDFVMYYVAMSREKNMAVVAYATSNDLVHWNDRGPVLKIPIEQVGTLMCESPCVIYFEDRWYLFFKHGKWTKYSISHNPFEFSLPQSFVEAHAVEVFNWEDRWYITHCEDSSPYLERPYRKENGLYLAHIEFENGIPKMAALK